MTEMWGLWPEVKCGQCLGLRPLATIEFFEWKLGLGQKVSLPDFISQHFFKPGLLWNETLATTSFMVIRDSSAF